jgi:hypothetical protein
LIRSADQIKGNSFANCANHRKLNLQEGHPRQLAKFADSSFSPSRRLSNAVDGLPRMGAPDVVALSALRLLGITLKKTRKISGKK